MITTVLALDNLPEQPQEQNAWCMMAIRMVSIFAHVKTHLKAQARALLLECGLSKRPKEVPPLLMGVEVHPQELCGGHCICLKPNSVAKL